MCAMRRKRQVPAWREHHLFTVRRVGYRPLRGSQVTAQIHPYVRDETRWYLGEQSRRGGIPIGRVIDLIMERAQRLGWEVTEGNAPGITTKGGEPWETETGGSIPP